MSDTELAALENQLQGIMECSDIINVFCLLGNSRLYKIHINRLNKLMCIYTKTNEYLINKYNEIPYLATNFEKLIKVNLKIGKDSELEWIAKMILSWEKWAETATTLYEKLVSEDDDNKKLWNHLYKLHKGDLDFAKYFKKKLVPEEYELPQTTKQKLQAKLSTQKQVSETE